MSEVKQIAYIELDCHSEVVNNFMTLMNDSILFAVDYYLADTVMKELKLERKKNIFVSDKKNILSQLKISYDLVIIGTANRDFGLYKKIAKKYPVCTIVHNINFVKTHANKIIRSLLHQNIKLALHLIKSDIYNKDDFYNKASMLVLDNVLASENKNLHLHFIPLSFYEKQEQGLIEDKINIVIPGTVSQKRRDYKHVLNKLKQFTSTISITLLGKASGKELEWIKQVEKDISSNVELIYFTKSVSQQKFDEIMRASHIIWSPVQQAIDFFGVTEYYGKSKISGNINDAIKFGKPILLPDFYESNLHFAFKESDNIEQQIIESAKKDFSFEKYNKENVLQQLEITLLSLLAK